MNQHRLLDISHSPPRHTSHLPAGDPISLLSLSTPISSTLPGAVCALILNPAILSLMPLPNTGLLPTANMPSRGLRCCIALLAVAATETIPTMPSSCQ